MARKPSQGNAKFNTKGNYTWDADQEFTVYGKEIDLWNRTFNVMARDPQFEKFIYLQEALKTMQTFFQESYEEGLIKELKDPIPSEVPKQAKATEAVQEKEAESELIAEKPTV